MMIAICLSCGSKAVTLEVHYFYPHEPFFMHICVHEMHFECDACGYQWGQSETYNEDPCEETEQ